MNNSIDFPFLVISVMANPTTKDQSISVKKNENVSFFDKTIKLAH